MSFSLLVQGGGGNLKIIERLSEKRLSEMSFSLLVQRGHSENYERLSEMSFSLLVQLEKYKKTLSVYQKCPFRCWYNGGNLKIIERLSEMSFSLLVQLEKY